jgi:hypothetical protein
MRLFSPLVVACAFAALVGSSAGAPAQARQPAGTSVRQLDLTRGGQMPASEVRNELRELLQRYPPALGRVFRLDSTLMLNQDYLTPYPDLAAFLQQHPEVARDPAFYLDFVSVDRQEPQRSPEDERRLRAISAWQDMVTEMMVFAGFVTAALAVGWLIRYAHSHRRWLRTFRAQIDLQNRLLERFGSSQELLAYLQSRGTTASLLALPADAPATIVGAPLGRILWAVQAGVVLGSVGLGLLILKRWVAPDVADMLLVPGVLAIALGAGFALAAAASYGLSRRLGLLDAGPHPASPAGGL